jgi:fructan beta-fructosidase
MQNRVAIFLLGLSAITALAAEDLIVADFEGADYGGWITTGEAFGQRPAQGTLQGQMPVEGFQGKGLVNSFQDGDDTTGTLVSPPIKVERKFLNFLIGGGGFPGKTCFNLKHDGKVVRTATGTNVKPGGSERLDSESWDLSDMAGQTVTLEVIDSRKGSWGHLNVDQIVQSDTPGRLEIKQEFAINQRYLVWPVCLDTKEKRRFFLTLDGEDKPLMFSDICLSNHPDFWVFTDLANYQGRRITVTGKIPSKLAEAWRKVKISATYPGEDVIYQEPLRPQYHFTSRRGWINDPNGLVWKDGTWRLFYQHNPYNHGWDNMHWGHATSTDLFHWKEHPPALFPDAEGAMFSGSAVVAPKGSTGFPIKGNNALVLAYTANGRLSYVPGQEAMQGIAVSNDNGKTFDKYPGNPVIPHFRAENRDPKVFWHAPSKHWVLNLYYDGNDYAIYTSPDLVKWEKTCDYQIPGEGECPDMFELPVDGDRKNTRWVVWGANGKYMLGSFDGRKFTVESGPHRHYFGNAYAGQTYDNTPAGRRVHIGWMRAGGKELQGAPFNCQMTLPMDFSLRKSGGAIRMWAEPSAESIKLRESSKEWKNLVVGPDEAGPLDDFVSGQFEVEAVIDATSKATEMGFKIFSDHGAVWNRENLTFAGMEGPQPAIDGRLHVRIFVDTVSMEVFVNGTYTGRYLRQTPGAKSIRIFAAGGPVRFESLKIHTLRSVWK